ncbi:MAG: ABC transporter ATP-binding protein [Phycisphaeraceae bacterium]|nr:ABC transporter ATP-binding protein [Phycisphaeraceae bacterium]
MQPALDIQNLHFAYPGGPTIIDVPSLSMARGEQLLLTAGSGAGKSTLLHLIAGLMDPSRGVVAVDGTIMHELHGARRDLFRGRKIGMIFQTFNLLLGFSAIENIMAALMFSSVPAEEHRAKASALLAKLGIDRQDARPTELSVGQQQRIAVARAVVCEPVLVLADEPTASLDPENSAAAMELIQGLCRETNAALLCVSHDPAMRERFSKRLSLAEVSRAKGGA